MLTRNQLVACTHKLKFLSPGFTFTKAAIEGSVSLTQPNNDNSSRLRNVLAREKTPVSDIEEHLVTRLAFVLCRDRIPGQREVLHLGTMVGYALQNQVIYTHEGVEMKRVDTSTERRLKKCS